MQRKEATECVLFTELFRPFSDSASHFKKSCEGAEGVSSFAVGASLIAAGTVGGRAGGALPLRAATVATVGTEAVDTVGVTFAEVTVATVGLVGAVVVTELVFPPAPTVVHAPPARAGEVGYVLSQDPEVT